MAIDAGQVAGALDAAVRAAGVPLSGIAIGSATDRTTWKAVLEPGATPQQQTTAQTMLAAFDPATLPTVLAQAESDRLAMQGLVRALVAYVYRVTHAGTNPTGPQLQAELAVFKTIYKALT